MRPYLHASETVRSRGIKLTCVVLLIGLGLAVPLFACSVPVFRYALERWPVDAYRLVIFHEGDLSEDQQAQQQRLEAFTEIGYGRPPLITQAIDTGEAMPEALTAIWDQFKDASLPRMVLLSPAMGGEDVVLWSASLEADNVTRLTQSPVRRALAERLADGETAVWLLLQSDDPAKNEAVTKALEEGLEELESTLKLPHELDPLDTEYDTSLSEEIELKIDFSILPMSMDDPCEVVLASMFKDIVTAEEGSLLPAVVPVFGRARALIVLDHNDVVLDTLAELCHFLVGPCSCQVKQMNPGVDLPVFTDWDARIMGMIGDQEIPTDLFVPGAMPTAEVQAEVSDSAEAIEAAVVDENSEATVVETAAVALAESIEQPNDTNSAAVSTPPENRMNRRLIILALIGIAAVGGGTALILKGS